MKIRTRLATLAMLVAAILGGSVMSASGAYASDWGPCEKGPYHTLTGGSVTASLPSEGTELSKVCLSRQGDAGSGVSALQRAMKACYGQNIATDGQFGPATRNALLNVQRRLGVTADGIYGPETGNRMYFPTNYSGGCNYKGAQYDKYGWWPGP